MRHFRAAMESVRATVTEDLLDYYSDMEQEFKGGSSGPQRQTGGRIGFQ